VAWILLLLFAFAVPWEYSLDAGEPVGNIARVVGLLLLLAIVPAILQTGRVRSPGAMQWLTLTFFLWICCSLFWSIEPQATLACIRAYFQGMISVWAVWELAETPADLRALLRAYVAGSWVLALLTIADLASSGTAGQIRFSADGQDPNDVARFLNLGFPMAALLLDAESKRAERLLAFGYLPVGLMAVLLTASRGGFVGAMVALLGCGFVVARNHLRVKLAGAFALPVFTVAFWFTVPHETLQRIATIPEQLRSGDLNQRLNIWNVGWQAYVHAPFLGMGAGSFVSAAGLSPIDTAHNTELAIVVEVGVCGLLLAAAILAVCVRSVLATAGPVRIALGTALLVWGVTSMVATVQQNRTTWLLLALISLAGRLAAEDSNALSRCFSGNIAETAIAESVA